MSYVVYDPSNPLKKYYFDKSVGSRGLEDVSVENVENRTELKTFGRFPYVYYAGHTDYAVFELSTVFIPDDEIGKTARQQVDEFRSLVKQRKTLTVENGQGQTFKCDVQIIEERSPKLYVENDMEYIEIRIRCTQISI